MDKRPHLVVRRQAGPGQPARPSDGRAAGRDGAQRKRPAARRAITAARRTG